VLAHPMSFTPFSLSGATSHSIDVATPLWRVTLSSHGAKMSSMSLLHISTTLHSVASPLEPKLMYWIHTTAAGHPLQITRLPSSTAIKRSSQSWSLFPPLNRHYFAFSLARISHHRSSTHCHRSLSPPFHVHHSSAQWHPR
jgi:hypothetical protein